MSRRNRELRMQKVWEKRGRQPIKPQDTTAGVRVGNEKNWRYVPMSARYVKASVEREMKHLEAMKKEEDNKKTNDSATDRV